MSLLTPKINMGLQKVLPKRINIFWKKTACSLWCHNWNLSFRLDVPDVELYNSFCIFLLLLSLIYVPTVNQPWRWRRPGRRSGRPSCCFGVLSCFCSGENLSTMLSKFWIKTLAAGVLFIPKENHLKYFFAIAWDCTSWQEKCGVSTPVFPY